MRASVVVLSAALAAAPFSFVADAQSVTVVVNGQTVNFAESPLVRTGRVFVPLRGVFERLGASVVYADGQINATANGRSISLTIGSTEATIDGQNVAIDIAPFIVGATTFVPLRFISQALGAAVNWNDSTSTVTIENAPLPPAQPPPAPRAVRFVSVGPTGTISTDSPAIRFEFDRPVELAEVRMWVDGRDVTPGLHQRGPASFGVVLPWPLDCGPHRVRVSGTTAGGAPFDLDWTFVRGD